MREFAIGDRVKWTRDMLRCLVREDQRGSVESERHHGNGWQVVNVLWDDGTRSSAISANLLPEKTIELD